MMDGDPYVTHLGDGCYARWTGFSIIFTANHHLESHATDSVSLDMPYGLSELNTFVANCQRLQTQLAIIAQIFPEK